MLELEVNGLNFSLLLKSSQVRVWSYIGQELQHHLEARQKPGPPWMHQNLHLNKSPSDCIHIDVWGDLTWPLGVYRLNKAHTHWREAGAAGTSWFQASCNPSVGVLSGPTQQFLQAVLQDPGLPVQQSCISLYFQEPWILKMSFLPVFINHRKLFNLGNLFNEQLWYWFPTTSSLI